MDLNNDDVVDPDEMRQSWTWMRSWDVSAGFIAADSDEDGLIDLQEWLACGRRFHNKEFQFADFYFY